MSVSGKSWLFGLLLAALPLQAQAAAGNPVPGTVHLAAGEMSFVSFLEMLSDRLDLQIDASALDVAKEARVTVPELGPVSPERARAAALTCLHLGGLTWIEDSTRQLYRIEHGKDARDEEVPIITEASKLPDSDLLVTYLLPIRHLSPEEIARLLRSFMPAASRIIPDEAGRRVIITDTARNISKLGKMIEGLDKPETLKRAEAAFPPAKHAPDDPCPPPPGSYPPPPWMPIALFSLIALVVGFLARGYLIRRIEGGL